MDLVLFCCCQNKVRCQADESLAQCPNCQRLLEVISGPAERVDTTREGEWVIEKVTVSGQEISWKQRERAEIIPGAELAAVWFSGQLVGVADASRQLWFPGPARQPGNPASVWVLAPLTALVALLALLAINPLAWIAVGMLGLLAWRFPAQPDFELGWDLE